MLNKGFVLNYLIKVVIFSAAIFSVGCSSYGNRILETKTKMAAQGQIVPGHTSQVQVAERFGMPYDMDFTEEGAEIWKYELTMLSWDIVNYIPVVRWFGYSSSGKIKRMNVVFDQNKIVKHMAFFESEIKEGHGIFSEKEGDEFY